MLSQAFLRICILALAFFSVITPFPQPSPVAWAGDEGFDDPILIIGPAQVSVDHIVAVSDAAAVAGPAQWTVKVPKGVSVQVQPHADQLYRRTHVTVVNSGRVNADGSIPVQVTLHSAVRDQSVLVKLTALLSGASTVIASAEGSGSGPITVNYTVPGQ